MVNIGLLGDISAGKTSILRLFVKYLKVGDIEKIKGGQKCTVVKTDFSGEATIPGGDKEDRLNQKETKTIHPNRVVFREDKSGKAHTIFAPGGDRQRSVIRMGIITISRIANQIIAVFSCDRPLKTQLEFFRDVRFFPDNIRVCLNKVDLLKGDKEQELGKLETEIREFFKQRKIAIVETFITCAENVEGFKDAQIYNDRVVEMLLSITTQ
jgi:translation elongation factor EF-Tu-like GTPase